MVKAIPDGYHNVQPYLIFKNCAAALEFYIKAFGAKEKFRMPNPNGTIGHAEILIGDATVMMADEAPQVNAFSVEHFGGSPVSFHCYTENCDALYEQALSHGAISERKPEDQPYGDRMAGVRDPFGYRWYFATHVKDVDFSELGAQTANA